VPLLFFFPPRLGAPQVRRFLSSPFADRAPPPPRRPGEKSGPRGVEKRQSAGQENRKPDARPLLLSINHPPLSVPPPGGHIKSKSAGAPTTSSKSRRPPPVFFFFLFVKGTPCPNSPFASAHPPTTFSGLAARCPLFPGCVPGRFPRFRGNGAPARRPPRRENRKRAGGILGAPRGESPRPGPFFLPELVPGKFSPGWVLFSAVNLWHPTTR